MIRKIQNPNDLAEFQSWALSIPQTPQFNWTEKNLIRSFENDICFGLWDDAKLDSVVCFLNNSDPSEILWLATAPTSEKRGFMKQLLVSLVNNTSQQWAPKGGQILLEVHQMNLKAIKLYASLGFAEFGRRKKYYQDGSDALLMTLKVE